MLSKQYNFMGVRRAAAMGSLLLVLISLGSLATRGLDFGLDFTSGTSVRLNFSESVAIGEVNTALAEGGYNDAVVVSFGSDRDIRIILPVDESVAEADQASQAVRVGETITALLASSTAADITLEGSDYVSAKVGTELAEQGGLGMLVALGIIMVYIAVRFQFKFSVGAVLALFHDVVIILGLFSIFQWDFDLTVFAALLAVIGYSLNDTIVVADRIRENFRIVRKGDAIEVINLSLNQTLGRTIMTSLTTALVLVALMFLGGELIHNFALGLFIGVVVGTYSSIYVAANILLMMNISREDLIPAELEEEIDDRP